MKHEEEFSLAVHMQQRFLAELRGANEVSARFGLRLSEQGMQELAKARTQALVDSGRVEFGTSAVRAITQGFCDSPYLLQEDYEATLPELVDAFYYFKNACGEQLTDDELIHRALTVSVARVESLTARLAVVEPKAAAFDRWLSSNVHYGVAEVSQALHDLGADMGRNRLFAYMQDQGWIYRDQRGDWRPYQAQIETRRLAVKLSRCENSRTGEEFAAHTVRITAKGAVALAVMLNVAPADLAEALTALTEEAAS